MAKQVEQSKPTPPVVVLRNFLDTRITEIRTALPSHISAERFIRVVTTAVQRNPDLLACDRQSLWNACMSAANDGLLPDGDEAALVPFKNRVVYIPMYRGLLKKFRNSGSFRWVATGIVYQGEPYQHWIDENGEHFKHVPGDDQDPKKIRRVYALATTKDGGSFIADLSLAEVKKHQAFSRTTRDDSPWKTHWEAMARKTAIKSLAKLLPMSSDLDVLMKRDEDAVLGVESDDSDVPETPTERQDTKSVLDHFAGYPSAEEAALEGEPSTNESSDQPFPPDQEKGP